MNQELIIGDFKFVQDEDGFAVMRAVDKKAYVAIATFINPIDALEYFFKSVVQATAYENQKEIDKFDEATYIPKDDDIIE